IFADEIQRPRRPQTVQLVLQLMLMGQTGEDDGRRAFPGRRHDQHRARFAVGSRSPSSAEDGFAVLPQGKTARRLTSRPNFEACDRAEQKKSRKIALRATLRSLAPSFRTDCKIF